MKKTVLYLALLIVFFLSGCASEKPTAVNKVDSAPKPVVSSSVAPEIEKINQAIKDRKDDDAFFASAKEKLDISICETIKSEAIKISCRYQVTVKKAVSEKSDAACKSLATIDDQTRCNADVSLFLGPKK